MASMAGLTIYNFPPGPPRWDRIGIFYIVFACTWTALVLLGMAFCWHHRRLPILKLRGLPLSFSAILCLHSYWILAMMTYPIGGTMPVVLAYDVQYFVMGIYFPLGIALFHASSCRFLHVAKMQKQFTHPEARRRAACKGVETWWLCRLANMYYSTRLMTFIAVGMVFQVRRTAGHKTRPAHSWPRSPSPSPCGWLAANIIPPTASPAPRSAAQASPSSSSTWAGAGNGGRRWCGRSSGPG